MSVHTGVWSGVRAKLSAKISPAGVAPVPVDLDAIADVYVPISNDQWTALGETAPHSIWLADEASGNMIDVNENLDLVATNSPGYEQSTDYWTRPGVGLDDASAQRFVAAAAAGPPPTEASLWLFYLTVRTEPTAARTVGGATRVNSASNNARGGFSPSAGASRLLVSCDGVSTTGSADHEVGRHVFAFLHNPDDEVTAVYSELELVAGTFSAEIADGEKGLGGNISPDIVCHYGAMWRGESARLSHAQVKSRLQKLRWTIPWSPP